MVLGRRVRTELSLVNPGFNYLLGLEAILLAARGGKEIRARTQQRTQGYFLLLARGAAVGACVLTRTRARTRFERAAGARDGSDFARMGVVSMGRPPGTETRAAAFGGLRPRAIS